MNPPAPLLQVDALAKRFCRDTAQSLRYGVADILRELLPARTTKPPLRRGEFWALEDVGFSIMPGEAVAIGGRNGAGKTTLLRMLAGLLKPDSGAIELGGSVNPVIELGQGLNPMLTGRENAEIGLAWRCRDRAVVQGSVAKVADFAELGAMFDAPVHSYSAGMRVRLAFAIAVAVPCDLLLLDEVLAVGDLAFQRKCIEHLRSHLERGGSLILVSHNPVQMQALCRRGILLEQGRLVFDGSIEQCIERMFELQYPLRDEAPVVPMPGRVAQITAAAIRSKRDPDAIETGDTAIVEIGFTVRERVGLRCAFSIWSRDLSQCIAHFVEPDPSEFSPGEHSRQCRIPRLPLSQGTYALRATLTDPDTNMAIDTFGFIAAPVEFKVSEQLSRIGLLARNSGQLVSIEHDWEQPIAAGTPRKNARQAAGGTGKKSVATDRGSQRE